jgi:SEC-C motif-containing protein
MLCPCGSTNDYQQCCDLLITQNELAKCPEQLMRSRYSAYANKQVEYIYNTYASESKKSQSITDISAWAEETTWNNLSILHSSTFEHVEYPTVEFEAIYKNNNVFYKMKEKSRFTIENNKWVYVDGDNLEHTELILPKRNDKCLCASGKKFKKCCG